MEISKKIRKLFLYSTLMICGLVTGVFIILIGGLDNINNGLEYKNEKLMVIVTISLIIVIVNIINYLFIKKRVVSNYNEIKIINEDKLSNKDNELLKYDNYKMIINLMTNSFYNFKSIEDENGYIVDGVLIDLNETGAEFLSINKKESLGLRFSVIYESFDSYKEPLRRMLNRVTTSKSEMFMHDINLIDNKWGNVSIYSTEEGHFSMIVNNITEIKNYSEKMKYIANCDELTGLLNRHSIFEYISKLIRENKHFSVYSLDLDNFKKINETLGYRCGDEVLKIIGKKLSLLGKDKIKISRVCSDEFIIVKEEENSDTNSEIFINEIFNRLNREYKVNIYSFHINLSIGVSYYPKHSEEASILLKYSSISMVEAKKHFGDKFEIFSDKMLDNINLEIELTEAINNEEFELYYQPIYELKTNKIVEAEALIRWIKDDMVISPIEFIPIAKKNGEIIRIDKFVIKEAAKYCRSLIDLGEIDFRVSINVSHTLLKQSYAVDLITQIVREEGVQPSSIKIEITEDETIDDLDFTIGVLNKLRSVGFKISLDDFGVGYSSFNHLKRLPLDTLKIDRSLLLSIESDKKTILIIDMLIKLSHTLDLDIICEGVEEKKEIELLRELNCDKIQGYYISKPIKASDFNEFIIEMNNIILS